MLGCNNAAVQVFVSKASRLCMPYFEYAHLKTLVEVAD